jgi:SAM-dependent methyltransferase
MHLPPELRCSDHLQPFVSDKGEEWISENSSALICPLDCRVPVVNGIPRFVDSANYTSSFGLQWKTFQKTQLDSYTGTTISRDRLTRCLGGSLEIVHGKSVLEAGCGAGRFTEVLLSAGARVFACDLSKAVEANYDNCKRSSNYFVCQADILKLPVPPEQFDIVVCIGVIQHTPNPEETMTVLCSYVKPSGLLVIDHYTRGSHTTTPLRRLLRPFLLQRSESFSMRFCEMLVTVLWPIHKIVWKMRGIPGVGRVRSKFLHYSPVADYHDAYYQLEAKLLYEWAILDTYDALTDYYKHLRSAEEIKSRLHQCGMVDIEAVYAGNGVEARARKP